VTNAEWIGGLEILIRALMMIVRWAQKTKKRLKEEK